MFDWKGNWILGGFDGGGDTLGSGGVLWDESIEKSFENFVKKRVSLASALNRKSSVSFVIVLLQKSYSAKTMYFKVFVM